MIVHVVTGPDGIGGLSPRQAGSLSLRSMLRSGLACQVHVALPEITEAMVVPVAAVADHSGTPVATVIRGGKAYETEVTTGVETKDRVRILPGLEPGDTVATAGGYGLPEGCPVQERR